MKCGNIREGKECGGELTKLKNYYVCDKCCKDTVTFETIIKTTQKERGAFPDRPKGPSIELLHPEVSGYYTYKISYKTEYFVHYTLYGQNDKMIGALHMEDYSSAKWMIEYRGPSNLLHFHRNGRYEAKTLMEGEIKFYT